MHGTRHAPEPALGVGVRQRQGGDEFLVAGQDRRPLGDDVAAGRQQDESGRREADPGGLCATDASMASRGSIFLTKVDFRAAQLAICSTSRPPPRTASPLAAPRGVERAAAPEMRAKARSCIFMAVVVCSVRFFRESADFLLVCYLI